MAKQSYSKANPMRPDKKASASENYKKANPYMKKGKRTKGNEKENPGK
jgi:hypothetical protein